MSEAIAAIRNAPPGQREAFWNGVRDIISDAIHDEAPTARPAPARRPAVVYYLRFADRVKIGFTTNLAERLRALPYDEVLATEVGGASLERQRHHEFAHLRVNGEWFQLTPELVAHIESLT